MGALTEAWHKDDFEPSIRNGQEITFAFKRTAAKHIAAIVKPVLALAPVGWLVGFKDGKLFPA